MSALSSYSNVYIYYERLIAMELKVIQINDNGIFGGPYLNDFEYVYNNTNYRVKIEQNIKREILIGTDKTVKCSELVEMESFIEQLLFVFDGRFYPIESAKMMNKMESSTVYQNEVDAYFDNRPPIYQSIDICRYGLMKLVNFKNIDLFNALLEFAHVSDELDIVFNILLYCLSDINMPVDCKISSMIEMAKPFSVIMEKSNDGFQVERIDGKNKLTLKMALATVMNTFGTEIFSMEINENFKEFLDVLVNTRNKISHVKSLQNKKCLDGVQCAFYIAKFSLLYRKMIFILIGINKDLYNENIIKAVNAWDKWYYDNK